MRDTQNPSKTEEIAVSALRQCAAWVLDIVKRKVTGAVRSGVGGCDRVIAEALSRKAELFRR